MNISEAKIVVLGGGNGANILSRGLSKHCDHLTTVVCMSDNGGSTGKLRQQYGVLPPGDVRKNLTSLAGQNSRAGQVFEYRFDKGDLSGHTVGNIFLAAYQLATGSMTEGVKALSDLLDLNATVLPVTDDSIDLMYRQPNGEVVEGEINISYLDFAGDQQPDIFLSPEPSVTDDVRQALEAADLVIIAPGLLYGSIAPVLMTKGLREAVKTSGAKLACIANITVQPGTDPQQTVAGYINEIERFYGESVDYVFANSDLDDPDDSVQLIQPDQEQNQHYDLKLGNFREHHPPDMSDTTDVPRVATRHDADEIARAIAEYVKEL